MDRIHRPDAAVLKGFCQGFDFSGNLQPFAGNVEDGHRFETSTLVGNLCNLKFQRLGTQQGDPSRLDRRQDRQYRFRFHPNSRLDLRIEVSLQAAAVEINAHFRDVNRILA